MAFTIGTTFSSSTTTVFLFLSLLVILFILLRNLVSIALTLLLFLLLLHKITYRYKCAVVPLLDNRPPNEELTSIEVAIYDPRMEITQSSSALKKIIANQSINNLHVPLTDGRNLELYMICIVSAPPEW